MSNSTISNSLEWANVPVPVECWLAAVISTLITAAAYCYLRPFPKGDGWQFKVMMSFGVFEIMYYVLTGYNYTLAGWGPVGPGRDIYALDVFTTTLRVASMHFGVIVHAADSTREMIAAAVVTCVTIVSGCCAISAYIVKPEQLTIIRPVVATWLACTAASTCVFAIAITVKIVRSMSPFSVKRSCLGHFIRSVVAPGSITAVLSIIALIIYLTGPSANLCLIYSLCIGHSAALTMLCYSSPGIIDSYSDERRRKRIYDMSVNGNIPQDWWLRYLQKHCGDGDDSCRSRDLEKGDDAVEDAPSEKAGQV